MPSEHGSRSLALALLVSAQFLIILDVSIINVALPAIQDDLEFSPESLSWVVTTYSLFFGGFLLLGGRLADLVGRRRMFTIGMAVFATGSLVGGFSHSELQLIICRGVQGLGAAMVSPAALSTVTTMFREGPERNRAFGAWGAAAGAGGTAGTCLGGVITDLLGWQWILFISVPFAAAAVLLAPRLLIESRDPDHGSHDVPGAVTVTASLLTLVYAIVNTSNAGWDSAQTILLLATSAILMIAFVTIERRTSAPLIDFSILKLKAVRAGNLIVFAYCACGFASWYAISLYSQQVLGHSALATGLFFLPSALAIVPASAVASRLIARHGVRTTLMAGSALTVAGMLWMLQISPSGSFLADILGPTMLVSIGLGPVLVAVNVAALSGTDESNAGLGSGLVNTSKEIGGSLGLAIFVSVSTAALTGGAGGDRADPATIHDGLVSGLYVATGFAVLALALSMVVISSEDSRRMSVSPGDHVIDGGVATEAVL